MHGLVQSTSLSQNPMPHQRGTSLCPKRPLELIQRNPKSPATVAWCESRDTSWMHRLKAFGINATDGSNHIRSSIQSHTGKYCYLAFSVSLEVSSQYLFINTYKVYGCWHLHLYGNTSTLVCCKLITTCITNSEYIWRHNWNINIQSATSIQLYPTITYQTTTIPNNNISDYNYTQQ